MPDDNLSRSVERDIGGDARLFVRGKCSVCGCKAQRRMHGEDWFHVSRYDDFGIAAAALCPDPEKKAVFLQEEVAKVAKGKVEPHYREKIEMRMDYDHVNEETGLPEPIEREYRQPVLCTCTNPECEGYGKPLSDHVRKLREEFE